MSKNRLKTELINKYSAELKIMVDEGETTTSMKKWLNNQQGKPGRQCSNRQFITRQNMVDFKRRYKSQVKAGKGISRLLTSAWTAKGLSWV